MIPLSRAAVVSGRRPSRCYSSPGVDMRRARTAVTLAAAVPAMLQPVDSNLLLFDSWGGRYTDHPRALHESLLCAGSAARHLWVAHQPPNDQTSWVRPGTVRHMTALHSAGLVITNSHLPRSFRKRRGTSVLQTWHGSGAMKKIGFHLADRDRRRYATYLRDLERDVRRWDLLLSPGPLSTALRRSAFQYDGPVLECGSPRNDRLFRASDSERDRIRGRLGLTGDERLVLYAPTYRDHGDEGWMAEAMTELQRSLPTEWKVLFHPHDRSSLPRLPAASGLVADRSAWDVVDLCIAADVLVTDYSSIMFDFLITDRPVALFSPDLEHYRDSVRGLYVDYEREVPGTVVRTVEDLRDVVTSPDTPEAALCRAEARRRWLPLDDGRATERVVRALADVISLERV